MNWGLAVKSLVGLWVASTFWRLFWNYWTVRHSGMKTYISAANTENPLVMILGPMLMSWLSRVLPAPMWSRLKFAMHGWQFNELHKSHIMPAPTFVLVTSGINEIWSVEAEFARVVLTNSKAFVPAEPTRKFMSIFGPNVLTTYGNDWQRHRKVVAKSVGEPLSRSVWEESCNAASDMLENMRQMHKSQAKQVIEGIRDISVRVIGSVGYGIPTSKNEQAKLRPPGRKLTYYQTLNALVTGFMLAYLLPVKIMCLKIMPEAVQMIGHATREFPIYVKEMLEKERKEHATTSQEGKTFISTLVRLSDSEQSQNDPKASAHLTEREIAGNSFIFTIAGFDTTANTMGYALALLSLYPEWQDWIIEEIDHVLQNNITNYEETFPKLTRCLAVMFEVVRLYTPLSQVSRGVVAPQTVPLPSKTYHIPARTQIYLNIAGMHVDPAVWGPDPLTFRPNRWIPETSSLGRAALRPPPNALFFPWSGGPRICPGMKMAQVEFVAVFLTIFREYRIRPVLETEETMEAARMRLLRVMEDSQPRITLQMNRPSDMKLEFVER